MLLIMILQGEEIRFKNFIYINIFIMPYQIKKIGNYYQVKNKDTGQIKAKRTRNKTKEKKSSSKTKKTTTTTTKTRYTNYILYINILQ